MTTPGVRIACLGGGRKLKLSNLTIFKQSSAGISIDVPYITRTGKILFRLICSDSSSAVEGPYTITFDIPGANLVMTQRKVASGGEASGRSRLVIATLTGAPVTGLAKNINFAMTASTMSGFCVAVTDLPSWWSGTVGNVDASAANGAVASYTSPAIVTGVRNSLIAGCGGCQDGTLGGLALAGQGGVAWRTEVQMISSPISTGYMGIFANKLVPRSGVTLDTVALTVSGAVSSNWAAGLIELRP